MDKVPSGKTIFDPVRRKYVARTPEEEVRQYVIRFLTQQCGVPLGYICVETGMQLFEVYRRTDIQVKNRHGVSVLLIECKRPSVRLDSSVLEQAMRYNLRSRERFVIITNGPDFRCFERNQLTETGTMNPWTEIYRYPDWDEINS